MLNSVIVYVAVFAGTSVVACLCKDTYTVAMEDQHSLNIVKQKRKANCRRDTFLFLFQSIVVNKHIVEGKSYDHVVIAQSRKETGDEITKKINTAF